MNENNELLALKTLVEGFLGSNEADEVVPSTLRYALYARKSTEGAERQARSIPDQIDDCYDTVIIPLGITIQRKDIFREERSAKEAGTRPVFRRLIEAVESGKYDGIISWHPDRLARNMKDAGEIIDLLDRSIIKDLRFARAHFENTPNGKMTLGITFVLSKHYSEHLGESVNRGNRRITEKGGVLHKFKHGYRVMSDNRLIADGDNYLLIQEAFQMRRNGITLERIASFLNTSSYQRYYRSKGHQNYVFDEDAVSMMFKDPTYAGVTYYGRHVGLITDSDPTFTPILSAKEFLELHGEKNFLSKSFRATRGSTSADDSDFLRRFVICGHCGRYMTTTVVRSSSAKKTHYFYYRCENKGGCVMANSGPRGAVILDYVLDFLDSHRFITKSNYEHYKADVEEKLRFDTEENARIIAQATTLLGKKKQEFKNAKAAAADKNNPIHTFYTAGELQKMDDEIQQIGKELKKARERKGRQDDALLSYEDFLELFDNTVEILRSTTSMAAADEIIRLFFLNFTVKAEPRGTKGKQKQWSVTDHRLAKPYDNFVKNGDFLNGRHTHTLLELFKYITENPEPSEQLLEKLKQTKPTKPQLVKGLVF